MGRRLGLCDDPRDLTRSCGLVGRAPPQHLHHCLLDQRVHRERSPAVLSALAEVSRQLFRLMRKASSLCVLVLSSLASRACAYRPPAASVSSLVARASKTSTRAPVLLAAGATNQTQTLPAVGDAAATALLPRPGGRVAELVLSTKWRTACLSTLIGLDILGYSFPIPFLPQHLAQAGHGAAAVSRILSSFSLSALATGVGLVWFESRKESDRPASQQYALLALTAVGMALSLLAQALRPTANVLLAGRVAQGFFSQIAWGLGLASAASLYSVWGTTAVAWVMVGNAVGEVAGPVVGGGLFAAGGLRLPYFASAAMSMLLCLSLSSTAWFEAADERAERAECIEPRRVASAEGGAVASPMRDGLIVRTCLLLALASGGMRGALDILVPLWLTNVHHFSVSSIAKVCGAATLVFVFGSTLSGRLLERLRRRLDASLTAVSMASCAATAAIFLPGSALGVSALFCAYCGISAFVSVAATTVLEDRGKQLGNTDAVMALSTLFWTGGFATGGLLANAALWGGFLTSRVRLIVGGAAAAATAYVWSTRTRS